MKLHLDLLIVCLLCLTGTARCDGNGPAVIIVEEGTDVLLPCSLSTKENLQSKLFDWTKVTQTVESWKDVFTYDNGLHPNNGGSGQSEEFKGRVFHFQDDLTHGNASIMIKDAKVTDSGNYICDFPLQQKREKIHIKLVVGASPEPSVTILKQTKYWWLLQCEVRGASPKPEVEWRDKAGNKLPAEDPQVTERGGKYDIILQTTVTKSDTFSCVSTQEELSHHTAAHIDVFISGNNMTEGLYFAPVLSAISLTVIFIFLCLYCLNPIN